MSTQPSSLPHQRALVPAAALREAPLSAIYGGARRYMPIVIQLVKARLRSEVAGTFGGVVWWIAEPIISCAVYYFVFAIVLGTRTPNYLAFLLCGLILWRWMSTTVVTSSEAVSSNSNLFRQVHLPKLIFPLQILLTTTFKFVLALAVLIVFLAAAQTLTFPSPHLFVWVLLVAFLFLMGTGFFLSSVQPFIPDLRKVLDYVFRGLLFLSGVFFPAERVPEAIREYFYLNPFAVLIDSFRQVLMYDATLLHGHLIGVALAGLALGAVGMSIHLRYNRVYPKIVA